MMAQFLVSMVGVWGFAVLFHAPRRFYGACALCGAVAWVVYLIATTEYQAGPAVAALSASTALAILSAVLSIQLKAPSTMFLLPGIFPLVPGAGIYYSAYYMIQGDLALAASKGVETLLVAGGIALGLMIGAAFSNVAMRVIGLGRKRQG
ncbi:MAG: threonine/serine exporter family protein [Clostridiales bacterium]|nr:threonine/serine exporter family protein [Clostridiales bacterium]